MPRLDGPWKSVHGHFGDATWARPVRVMECHADARPGYNSCKAHEYEECAAVLQAKVARLADMIRRSKHCVTYTGAGLSTASGIGDYASKTGKATAGQSAKKQPTKTAARKGMKTKKVGGLSSEPTYAHRALVALFEAGHLKHWVQQNHDGLPQKAGKSVTSIPICNAAMSAVLQRDRCLLYHSLSLRVDSVALPIGVLLA